MAERLATGVFEATRMARIALYQRFAGLVCYQNMQNLKNGLQEGFEAAWAAKR